MTGVKPFILPFVGKILVEKRVLGVQYITPLFRNFLCSRKGANSNVPPSSTLKNINKKIKF
jgi:hypothetical protein